MRESRYLDLIKKSRLLNRNALSCCWFEPFYQLMRQTLWTEALLGLNPQPKGFEAQDYLHVHAIPDGNAELLEKRYPPGGKNMEAAWMSCLANPDKYVVVSPNALWSGQNEASGIHGHLKKRCW